MEHAEIATSSNKANRERWKLIALICIGLLGAGYAGNYHFVYGDGIALRKVKKVSWSLSETIINADEVKGLPLLAARVKYPLFLRAAERGEFE